jgi:hypothetical protein
MASPLKEEDMFEKLDDKQQDVGSSDSSEDRTTILRIYRKDHEGTENSTGENATTREGRNLRRASEPITKAEYDILEPPERIPTIITPRRDSSPAPYITRESYSPIGYPRE